MNCETAKFEKIRDGIESIVKERYSSLDNLNNHLNKEFGIVANVHSNSEEDARDTGSDYNLLAGINEEWGYVDIYYIKDNAGGLLVTETSVSEN